MFTTMLPQTASTPSRFGMPAHRYAPVSPRVACFGTVNGADLREGAVKAAFAQGFIWGPRAWSPPIS